MVSGILHLISFSFGRGGAEKGWDKWDKYEEREGIVAYVARYKCSTATLPYLDSHLRTATPLSLRHSCIASVRYLKPYYLAEPAAYEHRHSRANGHGVPRTRIALATLAHGHGVHGTGQGGVEGGMVTGRVCREVCNGLAYLHSFHRVHRDIKSDNIFVSDGGSVKIGDLGTELPHAAPHVRR